MTQSTHSEAPESPIQLPKIDGDEPVAVIPVASVAPLDGDADGERINTFALAPKDKASRPRQSTAGVRQRVLGNPLTSVSAAFALGFVLARVLR
jgi:hypothetical protein